MRKLEEKLTKLEKRLASPSVGSDKQNMEKEEATNKAMEDANKKSAVSQSFFITPKITDRRRNGVSSNEREFSNAKLLTLPRTVCRVSATPQTRFSGDPAPYCVLLAWAVNTLPFIVHAPNVFLYLCAARNAEAPLTARDSVPGVGVLQIGPGGRAKGAGRFQTAGGASVVSLPHEYILFADCCFAQHKTNLIAREEKSS